MARGMDLNSLDRGRARHPLFGRYKTKGGKDTWYDTTNFKKGFWTDAMKGPVSRRVQRDLVKMIDGLLKELASKHKTAA